MKILNKSLLFLFLYCLFPSLAFAQVPDGGIMLNDESVDAWIKTGKCTAKKVDVSDQEFTTAIEVVVGTDLTNTWDAQLNFTTVGGISEDDVILVAFFARTTASLEETGEGSLNVVIEKKVSYEKQLYSNVHIGREWKEYYARAKIAASLAQSDMSLLFHIGFPSQTVEVANVRFLNYQNTLSLEDLPETEITYVGQAMDAAWRGPADERIAQIRKGAAAIKVYDEAGELLEGAQVQVDMKKHQFGFGTAIASHEFNTNETYRNTVLENFNEVVFENDLKWPQFIKSNTHAGINRTLDTLETHGIPARGHNVIWPSFRFCPQTVEDLKDDPEGLRSLIDERIDEVTSFTRGRLNDWDVINEPFSEHDIQDILGDEVMADWFKRVRRSDRAVKLYLNDYSILSASGTNIVKQDYYYGLIQDIEKWGGEVNGIGMQGHFGTDLTSIPKVYSILERFAELDKEIKITEFDINTNQRGVQADYTRDFMTLLFSHPSVKAIMVWGFWENRHWRPESAFYESDWTIRPHGEVWNEMIKNQWWTPTTEVLSDARGEGSFEGFLGTYSYTVSHGEKVRTGTFSLDNSFESGLENSIIISLDEAIPEHVEITPSQPGFICSGDLVTLQASEGEGLSYLWEYEGEALDQVERSILVGDSGSYTVTVSKNGVSNTSTPYYLEVLETPGMEVMVEGELEFCSDETTTLCIHEGASYEFDWYRNDKRCQWGDSTLIASVAGIYKAEVTNNGCTSLTESIEIQVNESPDASVSQQGESTFCSGESTILQVPQKSGTVYSWYRGEELLEETGSSLTVTESGSYTLVSTNENCSSTSEATEIVVLAATDAACTVGMEEELTGSRVFPNPFRGNLNVELPRLSGVKSIIEVYDAAGKQVASKQTEAGETQIILSIADPGLYMVRIIQGKNISFFKVVNH